jgi:hypothetical protein
MPILNQNDRVILKELIEQGILTPLAKDRLPEGSEKGTIVIACSDGDQSADLFEQHQHQCGPRCHFFAFNGGGLWLSPLVEGERALQRRTLIENDLPEAVGLKGIHTVLVYGHAPCGVAEKVLMCNAREVIGHLVEAKSRLRELYGKETPLKFVAAVHVDWGEGEKAAYGINAKRWRELA